MKTKITRIIACALAFATLLSCAGMLASCGSKKKDEGRVYYLNFKPEQDADWIALAKKYTEKTGVKVDIVTAASGAYEDALTSEMDKSSPPTLFQVNGPVGLQSWSEYCRDLSGSELYSHLTSDEFTLKDGDRVLGIAYAIETYGLIYNKALLKKYCSLDGAVIKDASEINGFDKLKAVAEDIQKRRGELGVDGAFTSAGMDSSSDWRFKTHLANLPIYYEYRDDGITSSPAIKGTYLANYKKIWDLYINNATCDKALISSKTATDASSEFVSGKAVFYQNGTWAYSEIKALGDDNLGILPIYIGVADEDKQGLCTGSENYWCVNKNVSDADAKATLDFLEWVITSDEGRRALSQDMNFTTPFDTFTDEYKASNPLTKEADRYIEEGKTPVAWYFSTIPSDAWKNGVGAALVSYASGKGSWDDVKSAFVSGWKTEYDKAHS